jgi:hypothetical protein
MRVLIYSETAEAKALCERLRSEKHHASLRNPQFFNSSQFDRTAELAITDNATILAAYQSAGIKAERLTNDVFDDSELDTIAEVESVEDSLSLESHTVAQLRALAEENEIDLSGLTKKADIIAAIESGNDRGAE